MRLLVLPNAGAYLAALAPELAPETQGNAAKRAEAARVHAALLACCGGAAYGALRPLAPPLPAPPRRGRRLDVRAILAAAASAAAEATAAAAAAAPPPPQPEEAAAPAATPAKGKGKAAAKAKPRGKAAIAAAAAEAAADADAAAAAAAAAGDGDAAAGDAAAPHEAPGAAAGGVAFEGAWQEDADLGPLFVSLAASFGDAWLPYVPTAPLAHLRV